MMRPHAPPPITMLGSLLIGLSAGFLGAGFLVPGAAEALLRMYLPALALAFALTRVDAVRLPRRMLQDAYSPFHQGRIREVVEDPPRVIQERARMLGAFDSTASARRAARGDRTVSGSGPATGPVSGTLPVPTPVRWLVIDEITRRLAESHGLNLADPSDWDAAQGLLSERTWQFVRPAGSGGPSGLGGWSRRTQVSISQLNHLHAILDDMERL